MKYSQRQPVTGKRETSAEAAESIKAHAGKQRAAVLECIQRAGRAGVTRDEICATLEKSAQSVTPRVLELIDAGDVVETTERRKTRSGRSAIVIVDRQFAPPSPEPFRYVERSLF